MKKIYLILLFLLFSFPGLTQKVKKKGNIIFIDKKEYVKLENDKVIPGSFYITNLNGEKLIYVKAQSYLNPTYITKGNPTGRVSYWEICNTAGDTIIFEYAVTKKKLCQLFYTEGVISISGYLDKVNLNKLSKKIGKEYSRKRREMRY